MKKVVLIVLAVMGLSLAGGSTIRSSSASPVGGVRNANCSSFMELVCKSSELVGVSDASAGGNYLPPVGGGVVPCGWTNYGNVYHGTIGGSYSGVYPTIGQYDPYPEYGTFICTWEDSALGPAWVETTT